MDDDQARTWVLYCHLSALLGFILGGLNFLGPLLIWLWKGRVSPLVADEGRHAVNFNLSIFIYSFLLVPISISHNNFLPVYALLLFAGIVPLIAAYRCHHRLEFTYPLTIPFIVENSKD